MELDTIRTQSGKEVQEDEVQVVEFIIGAHGPVELSSDYTKKHILHLQYHDTFVVSCISNKTPDSLNMVYKGCGGLHG